MRYVKVENDIAINYSIEQLCLDYPDASRALAILNSANLSIKDLLDDYNICYLITTNQPDICDGMVAVEGVPEFKDNEWHQTWDIKERTEEEIQQLIDNAVTIVADDLNNYPKETNMIFHPTVETQEQRYEICWTCPSFTSLKLCKECGCIVPLKVKTKTVCPLGKW
jgi:hypothetical protein